MPRVTIDGRHVDVPEGTTVLTAARQLGIAIPTLCQVEGLAPLTSCYVCVVQVVGRHRLSPSCATPVADGMVVLSDTPEVQAARRTAVELLLSDHLGECEAPCQISCPAGFRIPTYMDDLATGSTDAAAAQARADLVLPAILGRICPRFCENSCRRQERDHSVAIASLHRYTGERELRQAKAPTPPVAPATGKRVAIVGAGPTGLSAAFNLLAKGHAATLFDDHAEPGGTLRYSLDDTRLPKSILAGEVDVVRRMGAKFEMNSRLGRDVSLDQLRKEHDAVFLAVGAQTWQKLTCPGAELAESAGEIMTRIAVGEPVEFDGDVMVYGSGHEAIEVARTVARRKAASVTVISPRPVEHLPLLLRQIEAAKKDGVQFVFGAVIEEIRKPAHRIYVAAAGPKTEPVKVDGNRLLVATGRDVDLAPLAGVGLAVGKRGLTVDKATLATNVPGVFAGGDAVSGGGFCVRAVAYGQIAAESIDQFLAGRPVVGPARPHLVRYGKLDDVEKALLQGRARNFGARSQLLADDKTVRGEAGRCLICGCQDEHLCRLRQAATLLDPDDSRFKGERRAMEHDASHPVIIYESHKCIMCGACVAICEQARETLGLTYVGRGFNVRVAVPWGGRLADALGDLARRCAAACPTSAIVLKRRPEE